MNELSIKNLGFWGHRSALVKYKLLLVGDSFLADALLRRHPTSPRLAVKLDPSFHEQQKMPAFLQTALCHEQTYFGHEEDTFPQERFLVEMGDDDAGIEGWVACKTDRLHDGGHLDT